MTMWAQLRRWLAPARPLDPLVLTDAMAEPGRQEVADRPVEAYSGETPAPAVAEPGLVLRRRIAAAFDSTHPVARRRELFGRDEELDAMLEAVIVLQQHLLVHGARGSGKTSLVRIFGEQADEAGAIVVYMACEPGATFATTLRPYLRYIPPAAFPPGVHVTFLREVEAMPDAAGPRAVVELLSAIVHGQVVLILDEFDRLLDGDIVGEIASFMKLLSDATAHVQLVLVGIAHSVNDVIEGHPSLRRHMYITSVRRIAPFSVQAMIDHGVEESGLSFSPEARALIERVSCGSPYHIRLFSRFMAGAVARRGLRTIDEDGAIEGLRAACSEWAKTNEPDAHMFTRLTREIAAGELLEKLARHAAYADLFDPAELEAHGIRPDLLGGAVVADQRNVGKRLFQDSTAPQFLIASIAINDYSTRDAGEGQSDAHH